MGEKVAIIMGSKSDISKVKSGMDILEELEVLFSVDIISAHRTPNELDKVMKLINEDMEYEVIIAAAGMSAALPGCIAAKTLKPVIGLPLSGNSTVNDFAALLSITQMPPGIPVLTVGVDASKNAALAAAQIIATHNVYTRSKLTDFRVSQAEAVSKANIHLYDDNIFNNYECLITLG